VGAFRRLRFHLILLLSSFYSPLKGVKYCETRLRKAIGAGFYAKLPQNMMFDVRKQCFGDGFHLPIA
jgi:hypothetical protein